MPKLKFLLTSALFLALFLFAFRVSAQELKALSPNFLASISQILNQLAAVLEDTADALKALPTEESRPSTAPPAPSTSSGQVQPPPPSPIAPATPTLLPLPTTVSPVPPPYQIRPPQQTITTQAPAPQTTQTSLSAIQLVINQIKATILTLQAKVNQTASNQIQPQSQISVSPLSRMLQQLLKQSAPQAPATTAGVAAAPAPSPVPVFAPPPKIVHLVYLESPTGTTTPTTTLQIQRLKHVIWEKNSGSQSIQIIDTGASISGTGISNVRAVLDPQNKFHIVYQKGFQLKYWNPNMAILESLPTPPGFVNSFGKVLDIAFDQWSNSPYVAVVDLFNMYLFKRVATGWTYQAILYPPPGNGVSLNIALSFDVNGNAHIVYGSDLPPEVHHLVYAPGSGTVAAETIVGSATVGQLVDFDIEGQINFYVTYSLRNFSGTLHNVYLTTSLTSWVPQIITSGNPSGNPTSPGYTSVDLDSANGVLFVPVAFNSFTATPANPNLITLFVSGNNGLTWNPVPVVSSINNIVQIDINNLVPVTNINIAYGENNLLKVRWASTGGTVITWNTTVIDSSSNGVFLMPTIEEEM